MGIKIVSQGKTVRLKQMLIESPLLELHINLIVLISVRLLSSTGFRIGTCLITDTIYLQGGKASFEWG